MLSAHVRNNEYFPDFSGHADVEQLSFLSNSSSSLSIVSIQGSPVSFTKKYCFWHNSRLKWRIVRKCQDENYFWQYSHLPLTAILARESYSSLKSKYLRQFSGSRRRKMTKRYFNRHVLFLVPLDEIYYCFYLTLSIVRLFLAASHLNWTTPDLKKTTSHLRIHQHDENRRESKKSWKYSPWNRIWSRWRITFKV